MWTWERMKSRQQIDAVNVHVCAPQYGTLDERIIDARNETNSFDAAAWVIYVVKCAECERRATTLVKISLRPTMTCAWKNNDLWFPHKPACRGYKRFTSQTGPRLVGGNGVGSVRHGWDRPARGPAAPPKSLWPGSEYTGSSWRLGRRCTQTRWRAAVCATVQKSFQNSIRKLINFL